VQLGFENKKQTMWAAALGVVAILSLAFELIPWLTGSSATASSAQSPAPVAPRAAARLGTKPGKKPKVQNLDPTLRLDLLATSEQTVYQGTGRNIFVSQREDVIIPKPLAPGSPDAKKDGGYPGPPTIQPPPPIPLKFYGFASSPGEPKKNIPEAERGCVGRGGRRDRESAV